MDGEDALENGLMLKNRDQRYGAIYLILGLSMAGCGSAQGPTASSSSPGGEACAERHAAECFRLGVLSEHGAGTQKDEAAAAKLFAKACEWGSAEGCSHLGVLYSQGRGVEKDEAFTVGYFSRACELGDGAACAGAGLLLEQGRGVDRDLARAAELDTRACSRGSALGCFQLGALFMDGRGVDRDLARATELRTKACAMGGVPACDPVAEGASAGASDASAAARYAKACDGGDASSCFELGVLVEEGRGVSRDKARALELYKKACAGDNVAGCIHHYTSACDGGDAASCFDLGLMVDDGRGILQDRKRAEELFSRACKGGDPSGCLPEALEKHYSTMLSRLAGPPPPECHEPAPGDSVQTTTSSLRWSTGAPEPPLSDLNARWEPRESISSVFTRYARATGTSRIEVARRLLAAPMTLVIDVESEVLPAQTDAQRLRSGPWFGEFKVGSLTLRQVRFDPSAKAVCQTRLTIKNSSVKVPAGSTWFEAARQQLHEKIPGRF